ncbi:MAG: NUDIX hydrolase [Lachnospiraceae bacterium]|nr:NUDIX hydrolase [Lachnospiraceae bacterium]
MSDQFERMDRKLVYEGHIVDFYEDTVKVPNGNVVKWDFIKHKGAAAVVPVLPDGRILMVKQFRNALDRETLEIPAGGRNGMDEPYIECSHRELEEETGYKCELSDMEFLISIRTTVAFCDERIDVFVAKNLQKSSQNLDEDEFINVYPYTTKQLSDMIYRGEIQDSKTISSIMAYINKYEK